MDTVETYEKLYRTFPIQKVFEVVQDAESYNQNAVLAAKNVILESNLTPSEAEALIASSQESIASSRKRTEKYVTGSVTLLDRAIMLIPLYGIHHSFRLSRSEKDPLVLERIAYFRRWGALLGAAFFFSAILISKFLEYKEFQNVEIPLLIGIPLYCFCLKKIFDNEDAHMEKFKQKLSSQRHEA